MSEYFSNFSNLKIESGKHGVRTILRFLYFSDTICNLYILQIRTFFIPPSHTSLGPLLPPSSPCTWAIKHIITYPPPLPLLSKFPSSLLFFGGGGHPLWDWAKLMVFLQLSDCNLRPGIPQGCSGCGERESYLHIYFPFFQYSLLYPLHL